MIQILINMEKLIVIIIFAISPGTTLSFHLLSNDIIILSSAWPRSPQNYSTFTSVPMDICVWVFPYRDQHTTCLEITEAHSRIKCLYCCWTLYFSGATWLLCCLFNPGSEPLLPLSHVLHYVITSKRGNVFGSLSLLLLFTLRLLILPKITSISAGCQVIGVFCSN